MQKLNIKIQNTEYRRQNTPRLWREFPPLGVLWRISNFEFRILRTPVSCLVFLVVVCGSWFGTRGSPNSQSTKPDSRAIGAITRPSADITLSFVQPGRIARTYFKEGDPVEAGFALVQMDDAVEQAQLSQIKAESEDTTQIRASEAQLNQRKVDLQKLEKAAAQNAATALEVEHARLTVLIAQLSLELAKFEHEQAKRKYHEQSVRVENMRLKSPIDGTIEKIHVEVGEAVNALADVVRVVQIDPLWVDVPVPLAQATRLSCGTAAKVQFPGPPSTGVGAPDQVGGKIIFIAAVADAASSTLQVRVEVPNKSRRPAGEHVEVIFGQEGTKNANFQFPISNFQFKEYRISNKEFRNSKFFVHYSEFNYGHLFDGPAGWLCFRPG